MEKRIITFTFLTVCIALNYLSAISWISGFLAALYICGEQEGMPGKIRSIVIPFGEFRLHLHHWIIFLAMMLIGTMQGSSLFLPPTIFYGLLGGIAWQGIYCYDDWYRIIYRIQTDRWPSMQCNQS